MPRQLTPNIFLNPSVAVPPTTGSCAQGTAGAKLRTFGVLHDVTGPLRTLITTSSAAVQLRQERPLDADCSILS